MADNGGLEMEVALGKVCEVFGFNKLNEHQIDALNYVVKEKKDIFVNLPTGYGKSIVFQALPVLYASLEANSENNIVIVVSPLVSLMKDQVSLLSSLGISAISLNSDTLETERGNIENGRYSIVYGSPETWLGDTRWRKMLKSDTYQKSVRAIAVDEAHVICHWGQSKSQKHTAFRVWFSRLHELKSLLPGCPVIALTATATSDTRAAIFESLLFDKPHMVLESPDKENINYVVHYMDKKTSLSDYFSWISDEVIEHGTRATRTIIYCQTIKQCAVVYSTLKMLLGNKMYEDPSCKNAKRVLLEMLHSCSPLKNKENILESFQCEGGCIRILVATIAFGMGIDCKEVHRTVHFGPAKNVEAYMQESGRAGRDGKKSTAYILYQSLQLGHVERDIKNFLYLKSCRRKFLMDFFDVQCSPKVPLHLCCDNCSLACKCGLPECKILSYPFSTKKPVSSDLSRKRVVSDEQAVTLETELKKFHKSLLLTLLNRDASGNLKVFNHPSLLLGFSNIQISQVLSHCSVLFTIEDICNFVEIWDVSHAHKINSIMQKVFGDMCATESVEDELSSDEENDLLPEDWNDLLLDEELAEMAIEELTQADDSQDESFDSAPKDVPFVALNALMNLSFDAVL
ncbi:bifunctional 3'-5' exonuclease/ATP-dependent helicase WRN-like [Oculina patagonica]